MNNVYQVDPHVVVWSARFPASPFNRHRHEPLCNEYRFGMDYFKGFSARNCDAKRPKWLSMQHLQEVSSAHTLSGPFTSLLSR